MRLNRERAAQNLKGHFSKSYATQSVGVRLQAFINTFAEGVNFTSTQWTRFRSHVSHTVF